MVHWSSCWQSTCNLLVHHTLRVKNVRLLVPASRSRYWSCDCTTWQQCPSWGEPVHWHRNSENLNLSGLSLDNPTQKIQETTENVKFTRTRRKCSTLLHRWKMGDTTQYSMGKKILHEKDHKQTLPSDWNLFHRQREKLSLHHGQRHWGNTALSCTYNTKNRYMNVHVDTAALLVTRWLFNFTSVHVWTIC